MDARAPKEKVPFGQQLKSFGGTFWVANWMELIERFAYYGVRTTLPVLLVLAIGSGGPELTHTQKGTIFAIWALVQSFVPIFSGGFADRYGFKKNIAVSIVLSVGGYLMMGLCIPISEALTGIPLAAARAAGEDVVFEVFFAGAMLLAFGTAVFKPGIQGLIAHAIPKSSAATGWSIFYQAVNIGGFIGPLIGGVMRLLEFKLVFIIGAIAISLNFLPLLFIKEPGHERDRTLNPLTIMGRSLTGLIEPRLFFFIIAFAGFWLMFYQLFDILPNFIDDWVDSTGAANFLQSIFGSGVPTTHGGNLIQEWMVNLNALLISLFAFAMGYLTGKVTSLTAIVVGITISAVGILVLGTSMSGWVTLGAIAIFSVGEMAASPTKMRYLASICPPGQEGRYMGYVNATVGIGWSIGSVIAGELYQTGGDKIELARKYLVEHAGQAAASVQDLARDAVLPHFQQTMGVDATGTRELLWDTYSPQSMWLTFALIGAGSLLMLVVYTKVVRSAAKRPEHAFNTRGYLFVRIALGLVVATLATLAIVRPDPAVVAQAGLFGLMLVASLSTKVNTLQADTDG
ncbi:MAG: MFS transporter [Deltaproteobacteria bacterium]|nr:MAG: MFS transporter [Deltaproteobacteria bacterium]